MTLELTPEEFKRLTHHLAVSTHLRDNQAKMPTEKEAEIVQAIRDKMSNREIKRTLRTSDHKINELKKQYGLWGV